MTSIVCYWKLMKRFPNTRNRCSLNRNQSRTRSICYEPKANDLFTTLHRNMLVSTLFWKTSLFTFALRTHNNFKNMQKQLSNSHIWSIEFPIESLTFRFAIVKLNERIEIFKTCKKIYIYSL